MTHIDDAIRPWSHGPVPYRWRHPVPQPGLTPRELARVEAFCARLTERNPGLAERWRDALLNSGELRAVLL